MSTASDSPAMTSTPRFPTCQSRDELAANLGDVQSRIALAANRADRDPSTIRLLPVTKTMGTDVIGWLTQCGANLVGENKAQEARSKSELFDSLGVSWAMIGHLQTNKINQVVGSAVELHSLDRIGLATKLDRRLQELGESLDVFVQVNSSGEDSKYGLEPDDVLAFVREIASFDTLRVRGLMTLALFSHDEHAVGECFATMQRLQTRLRQDAPDATCFDELSMGMSGDYELAIAYGATTVRVGQGIFGARALGPDHYWPNK